MRKIQAYTIYSEEYDRLSEVDTKYTALINLIEKNNSVFITVTMIANSLGLSRQDVMNHPWHMPNFGKSENPTEKCKKRFWHYGEYLDWIAIPEYERIKLYREMIYQPDCV